MALDMNSVMRGMATASDVVVDRRKLTKTAAALVGFGAAWRFHGQTSAQDAPIGGVVLTREEVEAQIFEAYPLPAESPAGGVLIYGATTGLDTANIMLSASAPSLPILGFVFESLVGSSPVTGEFVPGLADTWTISEDGLTYTFSLHQGVTWHDGTPFTAADVLFSMDVMSKNIGTAEEPAYLSAYSPTFVATVASYTAPDDYTIVLQMLEVFAPIISLSNSYCPIIAKHIWEGVEMTAEAWGADPGSTGTDASRVIGTGPFTWSEYEEGAKLVLVRNDDYWYTKPNIDSFIWQIWPDDATLIEALRAGDIDFVDTVPPADVAAIQEAEDTDVTLYDTFSFSWYGYQLDPEKSPLFQDVAVRQALLHALDRQSMVDNILLGFASVANGTQPTLSVAYAPDQTNTIYEFNVDGAIALLDGAGWVPGADGIREKDGNRLAFNVMYGAGSATTDQVVAFMQESWAAVGVEMTPEPVDFSTVLVPALLDTKQFQMVLLGFNWDVTGSQDAMFGTGQGFNAMSYTNARYDEIAAIEKKELDPAARRDLLIEASNIANDELPVAVLWFRKNRAGNQTRVQYFNPNGFGDFWWVGYASVLS